MTNSLETNHTTNKQNSTGYYAVNAKRVIQVFELFQMRPSHFTASGKAGAQSVYYDARKIIQAQTNNKWGHHTPRAIKDFCYFTQSENESILPWQELVEYQGLYDGKEGAGRRTGNLLLTENRLNLKHESMILARQQCEFSQQLLAEKTALPLQFIEAMETGNWPTVAVTTASIITDVLDIDENTVFTKISDTVERNTSDTSSDTSSDDTEIVPHAPTTTNSRTMNKAWLLALPVFGFVFWAGYQSYPFSKSSEINPEQVSQHQNDASDNSNGSFVNTLSGCWNWSNGTYIVIHADGTANNGLFIATWKVVDTNKGHYTMIWPSFIDTLTLSEDGTMLSGHNTFNFPVTATRKTGVATDLNGTWLWSSGITMEVRLDSTIRGGSLSGTWYKTENSWVIEWPLVDSVMLSANGLNLSTKNQFGSVTAKRDVNCRKK